MSKQLSFDKVETVLHNSKDLEAQCIVITGNGLHAQKKIFVLLTYRPPGGNSSFAVNFVKEKVELLDNNQNEIVLIGDLNWNCINENVYITEICNELGLTQVIDPPTRITSDRNSLLDVVMTNIKNIAYCGCINCNVSDHLPVFVIKKRIAPRDEFEFIYKWSYRDYDYDTFCDILCDLDWSIINLLNDVNLAWGMLYKGLLEEVNKMCPYKNFRVKKNRPIWYDNTLCNLARERDILLRIYCRGDSSNIDSYMKMVSKRKEFNRAVKTAKSRFYNDQINQCKGDPKNFWKLLGDLLGKDTVQTIDKVFYPVQIYYVTKMKQLM